MIPAALLVALMTGAVTEAPMPVPRPALPPMPPPAAGESPTPAPPGPEAAVCRDPRLKGHALPDVVEEAGRACGIHAPVLVEAIGEVRLSQPATLDCNTARHVADWLGAVVRAEALEHLQSPVAEVWVMGSYACRNRNNVAGGKLSEHAHGRAIDVGGFTLASGERVTVERDWGANPKGDFLRRIWRRGCGPFHTVLGPESDRYHHDHLHLDTSPREGDPYCR
jgi:hypothetical protein